MVKGVCVHVCVRGGGGGGGGGEGDPDLGSLKLSEEFLGLKVLSVGVLDPLCHLLQPLSLRLQLTLNRLLLRLSRGKG